MIEEMHRRILRMVAELHARGYERLRIAPGLSGAGTHWRCAVTPVTNISSRHGAKMARSPDVRSSLIARHRTDDFGWRDVDGHSAAQMAEVFIERFSEIAAAGFGPDPHYAQWYREMLVATEPASFPIAYADSYTWAPGPNDHMEAVGIGSARLQLPLPPPGLARDGEEPATPAS